jgi:SAM-dependent methyltransferase
MRALISECAVADKVLLDLGPGGEAISEPYTCRQKIALDVLSSLRPSVVCDFHEGLPLAEQSVDIVVAGEVLEHVSQSRRFLKEVHRVLRPHGILVLSVPNIVSLKYRVAFLLGRIPSHAARADYTYNEECLFGARGHVRDYSFAEVRRVLRDQGLCVLEERSIGTYWHGRPLIPAWLMPKSFSDNVIVKAVRVSEHD